jgi:hypothetical protein
MSSYSFDAIPGDALVRAYNDVFSVRGSAPITEAGVHVQYVEDRLRVLLGARPDAPLNLTSVCALAPDAFLRLLFKAVAGDYISGATALGGGMCRLTADQRTGALEVTHGGAQHEVVLTVISLLLLCVLGVLLYRQALQHP